MRIMYLCCFQMLLSINPFRYNENVVKQMLQAGPTLIEAPPNYTLPFLLRCELSRQLIMFHFSLDAKKLRAKI